VKALIETQASKHRPGDIRRGLWRHGARVDENAVAEASSHSVLPGDDGPHGGVVRERGEGRLGFLSCSSRSSRFSDTIGHEIVGLVRRPVPYGDVVIAAKQALGNCVAHLSHPENSKAHGQAPSLAVHVAYP
jgi:hypothetical protein